MAKMPSKTIDNPTHISEHLKKRRWELKLKQAEVAQIIGVCEDSITYWENRRSIPQIKYYPKIVQFLGYNPFSVDTLTLGGKIKKYRIDNGLSNKKFGKLLGVDTTTISSWEKNFSTPQPHNIYKLKELINI